MSGRDSGEEGMCKGGETKRTEKKLVGKVF